MELGALQVIVVTRMTGVVLMVAVVLVVLGLLDDIISRTSSKQKPATLIMSHRENTKKAHSTNKPAMSVLTTAAAVNDCGGWPLQQAACDTLLDALFSPSTTNNVLVSHTTIMRW